MSGIFSREKEALQIAYAEKRKAFNVGGGQIYEKWWDMRLEHGQKPNFGGSCRLTWGARTFFLRCYPVLLAASDMVRFRLPEQAPCSVKSGLETEAKIEADVQVRWVLKGEGMKWSFTGGNRTGLTDSDIQSSEGSQPWEGAGPNPEAMLQGSCFPGVPLSSM